jgi:hypothetical protein
MMGKKLTREQKLEKAIEAAQSTMEKHQQIAMTLRDLITVLLYEMTKEQGGMSQYEFEKLKVKYLQRAKLLPTYSPYTGERR